MENFRVFISDNVDEICADLLRKRGIEVRYQPGISAGDLQEAIADYDGLIVRSATKVTAEIIANAHELKVIGRAGTGVDNIDVVKATERGIAVVNSLGGNTISAAEHAFAMMIALARHIPAAHKSMQQGKWQRGAFMGVELYGKLLGIIGLGKIGAEVAKRARAFGMRVCAYDPLISASDFAEAGVEQVDLPTLMKRCDFVTLHSPLNKQTQHLLSDDQFNLCDGRLRVINVSRGGVVDEAALLRALNAGKVAGAALDVFEKEPPEGNPLVSLPNVIVTPHLGASTVDAQLRVAEEIAANVADYLNGVEVASLVNPEIKNQSSVSY